MSGCNDRNGRSKRRYSTRQEAERHAEHALNTRGVRLRVYQCDCCWGYHLTSKSYGW